MAIVKDLAQVLRVYEHGNTSLVLVFLCRRLGQVRVLAKGARRWARKGFAGGFDLLVRGELVVYPRRDESLWIFKEWEERARPAKLGRSPVALRAASYLCELAEAVTRETAGGGWHGEQPRRIEGAGARPGAGRGARDTHEAAPHAALYEQLAEAADVLNDGVPPGPVLLGFTLRALDTAGLLPDLARCSGCGRALSGLGGARLGREGLECPACLGVEMGGLSEANRASVLTTKPGNKAGAAGALASRPTGGGARGSQLRPGAPSRREAAGAGTARSVWLSPEALSALAYVKRTGKAVKLSRDAAGRNARALGLLVHATLERDLRTLPFAQAAVARMARG
jgi:recombinational DNA repair protein (RecF pathway)